MLDQVIRVLEREGLDSWDEQNQDLGAYVRSIFRDITASGGELS